MNKTNLAEKLAAIKLAAIQAAIEDARTSIEAAFYSLDKAESVLDGLRADAQNKKDDAQNRVFPKLKKGLDEEGDCEIDINTTAARKCKMADNYTAGSCAKHIIFSCKFFDILKEGDNLKFCQRKNGDVVMKVVSHKTGIEVFNKPPKNAKKCLKANIGELFIKLGWTASSKEAVKVLFTLEAEGVFKMERR